MEAVFQYEIPVLHPIAVHFPPALLLAAALAAMAWVIRGTGFWRRCLLYLLCLGGAGTAFAYFTGDAMYDRSAGVPIVEELVGLHQQMALYALFVNLIVLAATAGSAAWFGRRGQPVPVIVRIIVGAAALLGAFLVLWTAHIGGTMTWGIAS